jgi:hypothetical protein
MRSFQERFASIALSRPIGLLFRTEPADSVTVFQKMVVANHNSRRKMMVAHDNSYQKLLTATINFRYRPL